MTYLVVTCVTGPSACVDRTELADRAERALLARLDRPVMDGILPDGGECRSGRPGGPAYDRRLLCHYPSSVTLSLDRKNEEETRQLIRSTLLP